MSIATVVTRGYGSFSTVNKVPVRGYSHGVVAAPTREGWIAAKADRIWVVPSAQRTFVAHAKE